MTDTPGYKSDEYKNSSDLLLVLRRKPELKTLVHSFFLSKMAKKGLKVNILRDANKIFHGVIFGKGKSVKGLTHKNTMKALKDINETEQSLLRYIESNIEYIPNVHDFEAISKCTDEHLPYYETKNQDAFFDTHLKILEDLLGENYPQIHSKLLTETIEGREYKFPAINLLNHDGPLSVNKRLNLKEISKTVVPGEFTAAIKKFMPKVQDNTTFTLNDLNLQTNEITCSTSSYLKTLLSCDRWFYEMISEFSVEEAGAASSYPTSAFLVPWAKKIEQSVIENTFSPDQSLGGSCLFIYNTDQGYEYLLGQKSSVANGFNELHVLPSFMFQPISKNRLKYAKELSVKSKVLQELAEEIFKYEEFESDGHDKFLQKKILAVPENARLIALLEEGGAEFHLTGLWLDMYRLRPEITSVLMVKDKNWFEEFFTPKTKVGNWEIIRGGVLDFATDTDSYESILSGYGGRMCPPGAAALISGMRLFKSLELS